MIPRVLKQWIGSDRYRFLAQAIAFWSAALLVLEISARAVDSTLVPVPSQVLSSLVLGGKWRRLTMQIGTTLLWGGSATLIGISAGMVLRVAASHARTLLLVFGISVRVLETLPPLLLVPLFLTIFGFSKGACFLASSLYPFFGAFVLAGKSLDSIPSSLTRQAKLFQFSWVDQLYSLELPFIVRAIKPQLLALTRLGLGIVVVVEFMVTPWDGLGSAFRRALKTLAMEDLTSSMVGCVASGILLGTILSWALRVFVHPIGTTGH